MTRPVVFVFARAPIMGAVKSRLARDIGVVAATRFHRLTLNGLCRQLVADPRFEVRLATTPRPALHDDGLWPRGIARFDQGQGDLGRRMISVLRSAGTRPSLLLGSDIPDARPEHILQALRLLAGCRHVLGPVRDGGYWLVGARHPESLPLRVLDGVRWSSSHALQDTVERLGDCALLPRPLTDVDDGSSYRATAASGSRRWRIAEAEHSDA